MGRRRQQGATCWGILLITPCTAINYIKIKLAVTQAESVHLVPLPIP